MSISVSVVVPTCRRPALLDRCLEALVAQDFDPSAYEVIVVDDGPEQATQQVVARRAERAEAYQWVGQPVRRTETVGPAGSPSRSEAPLEVEPAGLLRVPGLPRLRYLINRGPHGPAAARNLGWGAAEGEIIAFTDDDCLPAPDWLRHGVSAFDANVLGVSGRMVVPLPNQPTDHERNVIWLERSQFVTANCFYRRSALEEVGGFDERFALAWREDSDLFFSLLEQNARLVHAPGAVVVHPTRPGRWGASLGQQRKSLYNALVYKKHPALYRRWLQAAPPWRYYAALAGLLAGLTLGLHRRPEIAWAGLSLWLCMTVWFCLQRLRHTARTPSHILEMLVTSALIPPLSIYWRLRGAVKFRVLFF